MKMKPTDQWQVPLINKQVSPFPKARTSGTTVWHPFVHIDFTGTNSADLVSFLCQCRKKVQLHKQVLASTVFVKTLWAKPETCRLQKIQCTMYERG